MSTIKISDVKEYESLLDLGALLREFERFDTLGWDLKKAIIKSFGCRDCWEWQEACECEIDEDYDDDGEPYVNEDDPRIDR